MVSTALEPRHLRECLGDDPSTFISTYAAVGTFDGSTTTFSDPILLKDGLADYQKLDGSNRNRWGDYASTVLDPSDPTGQTFWTFQEFADSGTNIWSVQATDIIVPTAVVPEPSTFSLGVVAVFLFAVVAWRLRRQIAAGQRPASSHD